MKVYRIKGKHEDALFVTAVAAVRYQIEEVYQYEDDHELLVLAQEIVADDDEGRALRLLHSRSDWEYEGFDVTEAS